VERLPGSALLDIHCSFPAFTTNTKRLPEDLN
jgi:hypothetical protein